MARSVKNQEGFVLIAVYLLIAFCLVPSIALSAHSLTHVRAAQRSQNAITTHYLAEAALDQAVVSLRDPAFLAAITDAPSDPEIAYSALGAGGYEVDIDPVAGRPGFYRIEAVGYYPARQVTSYGFQSRTLESYTRVTPASSPPVGIMGDVSVELNGTLRVDSYDSRVPGGIVSTGNGVVGSNGILANSIRITGSTEVFGDVLSGVGSGPDAIRMTGSSIVTGTSGPATSRFSLPPVVEDVGEVDLLIRSHEIVTLPGGVHRYRSITVKAGGQLSFTGSATVYTSELSLRGHALATADNKPPNLTINVVGAGEVELGGSTDFYGSIYAPEASVRLTGTNRLYGSVVGRTLTSHGTVEIWYDDALSVGGPSGGDNEVTLLSWTDAL